MSCLGITNVDTIEQQRNLVECTAIDAYVRLNTKASTLPDIHTGD